MLLPVHWALFSLAPHGWTEPIERLLAAPTCKTTVLTPRPGQPVEPATPGDVVGQRWWPKLAWRTASVAPVEPTQSGNPANRIGPVQCTDGGAP